VADRHLTALHRGRGSRLVGLRDHVEQEGYMNVHEEPLIVVATPAQAWRAYVLSRDAWTEPTWEQAEKDGLAVRRVRQASHFWTLTDAGLDLMNEGKS
jgi:hypothetical protein